VVDEVGDEFRKFGEDFNGGAPVPPVDPEQLKRYWIGINRIIESMSPRDGTGGLGAIAGISLLSGTPTISEYLSVSMRVDLLRALSERGVLRDFERDGELSESSFQAAATMPMNIADIGEGTVLMRLCKMPPEEAAKEKAQWLAAGFDTNRATIDGKFIEAVGKAKESAYRASNENSGKLW